MTMGIIIQLDQLRQTRRRKTERGKSDHDSASVLLFTGVRYERVPVVKKPRSNRLANRKLVQ